MSEGKGSRKQPQKLSPEEAKRRIVFILKGGGSFIPLWHCYQRMGERGGISGVSDRDVINVLLHGEIIREPEWDDNHNNWKYRVEGKDIEGDDLTAITVIVDETFAIKVITVFG